MNDLDRARVADQFVKAYEKAEPDTDTYTYKGRSYRVRKITITIAEVEGAARWTPLPQALTDQLLKLIMTGEATKS